METSAKRSFGRLRTFFSFLLQKVGIQEDPRDTIMGLMKNIEFGSVYYDGKEWYPVNELIPGKQPKERAYLLDINERGRIAGYTYRDAIPEALLLQPLPSE